MSESQVDRRAEVGNNRSLMQRAVAGDVAALQQMVASFIPPDENVISCAHVGTFGFVFRLRAFFAITDRRAVSIIVRPFRGFLYVDGMLEHINSSGIGQPARGRLYFGWFVIWMWALAAAAVGVAAAAQSFDDIGAFGVLAGAVAVLSAWILSAAYTRWWFRRNKSGIFLNVREGAIIESFVDAKHLPTAMALYRDFSLTRDDRMAALALSAA